MRDPTTNPANDAATSSETGDPGLPEGNFEEDLKGDPMPFLQH